MPQRGGLTPMAAGINMATANVTGSPNFQTAQWQVFNISSDGVPNVGSPDGQTAAENASAAAAAAGIDEIDVEGVGTTSSTNNWMAGLSGRPGIVWPTPGVVVLDGDPYPPRDPDPGFKGFVRACDTWQEYSEALNVKFDLIIPDLYLLPLSDVNYLGQNHELTATYYQTGVPVQGAVIEFRVIAGPNVATDFGSCPGCIGTAVTDANGEAKISYTSALEGTDVIIAEIIDDNGDGSDNGLTSNEVEKTWTAAPPVVPSMSFWGILAAVLVVLGCFVAVRVRQQHAHA
jgi:hypothetical protein